MTSFTQGIHTEHLLLCSQALTFDAIFTDTRICLRKIERYIFEAKTALGCFMFSLSNLKPYVSLLTNKTLQEKAITSPEVMNAHRHTHIKHHVIKHSHQSDFA